MSDPIPQQHEEDSLDKIRADIAKMPISESAALEQILKLVQDDKGRAMFMRIISVSKLKNVRPVHYAKASNLPYYRVEYGTWMKRSVDKMLETNQEVIFLYADYKVSKRTLQMRCFQAFDFLINEMDDIDCKYAEARDIIAIVKEPQGVKLAFRRKDDLDKEASHVMFDSVQHRTIKDDVIHFLETAPGGSKFERNDLQLNEEEIEYFELMIADLINVRMICKADTIKIIKMTDEMIKMAGELDSTSIKK